MTIKVIPSSRMWPAEMWGRWMAFTKRRSPRVIASRARAHIGRGRGNVSSLDSRSSISLCSLSGMATSTRRGGRSRTYILSPPSVTRLPCSCPWFPLGKGDCGRDNERNLLRAAMDWRDEYKRRLSTAEEAMQAVKRDDLVAIPIAGPRVLPAALFRRGQELGGIDLRLAAPLTDPGWLQDGWQGSFRIEFELFIGDFARQATDEGRATYLPNLFSLNFKDHDEQRPERRPVSVFLTAVTPPDEEGYVAFGARNRDKGSHI